MIRNEVYNQGVSVEYLEIKKENGQYITDDNGTVRPSTESEIEQFDMNEAMLNEVSNQEIVVTASEALTAAAETLTQPDVNSIAEVKSTVKPALQAAADALNALATKL